MKNNLMKNTLKPRKKPNIRCWHEQCKEELEYVCELTEIAICPKCLTSYDLKRMKNKEKFGE